MAGFHFLAGIGIALDGLFVALAQRVLVEGFLDLSGQINLGNDIAFRLGHPRLDVVPVLNPRFTRRPGDKA